MTYAQLKSRLASLNNDGRPHPTGGDMINSDCFVHGCLTAFLGAGWILQVRNFILVSSHILNMLPGL